MPSRPLSGRASSILGREHAEAAESAVPTGLVRALEAASTDEERAEVWQKYAASESFAATSQHVHREMTTSRRLLPLVEFANTAARDTAVARMARQPALEFADDQVVAGEQAN